MPRTPRRLGLLDAMILVAAVAVGLAWMRLRMTKQYLADDASPAGLIPLPGWDSDEPIRSALRRAYYITFWAMPVPTMVALGVLLLRLRKPRPRRSRMFCQPGTAACVAVAVALPLQMVEISLLALNRYLEAREHAAAGWIVRPVQFSFVALTWGSQSLTGHPYYCSYAIVGAWTILILSGRWQAEKSAIDRLGRVVGVSFILACVLLWVTPGYSM